MVAYHEAGHAVVAHRLDRRIKRIWIDGETGNGGTDVNIPAGRTPEERFEEEILNLLAGREAAHLHDPEQGQTGTWASADLMHAMTFVRGHLSETQDAWEWEEERLETETDAVIGRLTERTQEIIGRPENWAAIVALATALIAKNELTGEEAIAIIEGAKAPPRR